MQKTINNQTQIRFLSVSPKCLTTTRNRNQTKRSFRLETIWTKTVSTFLTQVFKFQKYEKPSNQLFQKKKANNQWTLRECKGRLPTKRIYQHNWYEAPNFFIYGGLSVDKKVLHDMFCLNCETYTWKRFFFLEGPSPRLHSSFCSVGSLNYLIGGVSLPENLVMNDVWSLSFGIVSIENLSLYKVTLFLRKCCLELK